MEDWHGMKVNIPFLEQLDYFWADMGPWFGELVQSLYGGVLKGQRVPGAPIWYLSLLSIMEAVEVDEELGTILCLNSPIWNWRLSSRPAFWYRWNAGWVEWDEVEFFVSRSVVITVTLINAHSKHPRADLIFRKSTLLFCCLLEGSQVCNQGQEYVID